MSYLKCPDCGKEIAVFGESRVEELAKKYQINHFAKLPIDLEAARLCDEGKIEELDRTWLKEFTAGLIDFDN